MDMHIMIIIMVICSLINKYAYMLLYQEICIHPFADTLSLYHYSMYAYFLIRSLIKKYSYMLLPIHYNVSAKACMNIS